MYSFRNLKILGPKKVDKVFVNVKIQSGIKLTAVSYTHLDVYKRQAVNSGRVRLYIVICFLVY